MTLRIGPEAAGQRLDRALADRLPEHSRTTLAAWIEEGFVEIEGIASVKRARLKGGEVVRIWIPPPRQTTLEPEDRPLDVLFEDAHLLVLNKPTGLTVHPGSGQPDGTLANALVHHIQGLPEGIGSDRPGIVHRLDKDTSGVIAVTKTDLAQRRLAEAFALRRVAKTYLACVHGIPEDESGEIDLPIGRSPAHRTRMAIRPERGRPAQTGWRIERRLPRHALLRCAPVTGRTHQIRVHLNAVRHPIVGDPIYGNRGLPGEDLAPRLLLHAWRIAFDHPITAAPALFEAPLPDDFRACLDALATMPPGRRRR